MDKYDPKESITCPKCGRTYKAEVMAVQYVPLFESPIYQDTPPFMCLTSLCGFQFHRSPLDHEGDD